MGNVLVDTDLFIDHLRGTAELRPGRDHLYYSEVTAAELFAASGDSELVMTLLAPFMATSIDDDIARRAGRLRRDTGIRLRDALVAATALHHRFALATNNTKDFALVPGLRLRSLKR